MNEPIAPPELPAIPDSSSRGLSRLIGDFGKAIQPWASRVSERLRLEAPELPTPPGAFGATEERHWMQEMIRRQKGWMAQATQQLNTQVQGVGADIESADVIEVTNAHHHITGAATITQINVPTRQVGMTDPAATSRDRAVSAFTGPLWLYSMGGFALGTGGNIAKAKASTAGDCVHLSFDGDLWYPVS